MSKDKPLMPPVLADILKAAAEEEKEEKAAPAAWLEDPAEDVSVEELKRRARILHARGHSVSTLSREFSRSQATIYRWLREDREELEKFMGGESRFSIAIERYSALIQEIEFLTQQIELIKPDGVIRFRDARGEKEVTANSPEKFLDLKAKLIECRRRCKVDAINLLIKLGIITDDSARQRAPAGGEQGTAKERKGPRRTKEEIRAEMKRLQEQIPGLEDEDDE